jgi:competence protein ComEA
MIKGFTHLSSTERKASFVLVVFILIISLINFSLPYLYSSTKTDFTMFNAEIDQFKNDLILAEIEEEEEKKEKYYNDENYSKKFSKEKYASKEEPNPFKTNPKLVPFDPNTAEEKTLLELGLDKKVVKGILNFRDKGGKFRVKSDFSKIYHLEEVDYNKLSAFISLPDSLERKNFNNKTPKSREPIPIIDINKANTEEFRKLPGIGPSFSDRIVNYRNSIGGFHKVDQIADIYGFPDSLYQKIEPYMICKDVQLKKININTVSAEELKKHPFLKWKHVNAIVKYRKENGPYKSVETLRTIMEFDDKEKTFWKIKPYLSI